jgi:DNA modification methylase
MQEATALFSDSHIRGTLAEVDGVHRGPQRLDTVSFHAFPARMPLAMSELIVERLSHPTATVLDPMLGSGTTLIAARKLGRIGWGFDLDPLAVTLARATTLRAHRETLRQAHDRVLAEAETHVSAAAPRSLSINWPTSEDQAFLDYWFPVRSQQELAALSLAIRHEPSQPVQAFLWAVFSSLIIAKSSGVSYALDLAHSRPHRKLDKQLLCPLQTWTPRFMRALEYLERLCERRGDRPGVPPIHVEQGDARRLPLPDASVDLVLTSPPYLAVNRDCRQAIDYMRAHKFSLIWMGYTLKSLRRLRGTMIGTECGLSGPDGLAPHLEAHICRSVPRSAPRGRIRRYLSDLQAVLTEIHRLLKPGAPAVCVVGPTVLARNRYDAAEVIGDVASAAGLTMVEAVVRRLDTRRRTLPPPRSVRGINGLNKRMRSEVVIALRKPP